jgi:lipopolysaccharide transport system ATP-binding protein
MVISVENLSKTYHLGQIGTGTFAHDLNVWWAKMRGNPNPSLRIGETDHGNRHGEELWALRDVSFTVQQGEVLGIIGRNGAGKSTLLKILSRVTAPTSGRIRVKGRVASLLEVGTGFHPELTGRENIYLNGAILGMNRKETDRKFDEIVDFSGVGKFIDTPVKRYSSGMYVRLAFAVAAHLDPEILVVDEVLAVGDAEFQKKCLGKMGDVARDGRTVLFVSHNMGAIQTLCERGIFLKSGIVDFDGPADKSVVTYLRNLERLSSENLAKRTDRKGVGDIRIAGVSICDGSDLETSKLSFGAEAKFIFRLSGLGQNTNCIFTIYDSLGQAIVAFQSVKRSPLDIVDGTIGSTFICSVEELLLAPGRYRLNVAVYCSDSLQDHIEGVAFFDVEPNLLDGRLLFPGRARVFFHHRWTLPQE